MQFISIDPVSRTWGKYDRDSTEKEIERSKRNTSVTEVEYCITQKLEHLKNINGSLST